MAIDALGGGESHPTRGSSGGPLPAISLSAPPHAHAQEGPCAKVLAQLPVRLGRLAPRVVHTDPDTPDVVAWGDPAVVLSCGAAKPKVLFPGSAELLFNAGDLAGPYYTVQRSGDANVYTIIDREPYIAITVPSGYQAGGLLPDLIAAVGKALPPVCTTDNNAPDPDTLCTRRK